MNSLKRYLQDNLIKLVIWDFDGVIFDLNWNYKTTPHQFLELIYDEINSIDTTIVEDKDEFIKRLFPYPEINEVGIKYGQEAQMKIKSIYQEKESTAVDRANPIQEVIDFIKNLDTPQSVWSNNYSSTIEYLLIKSGINKKIENIASFDKVTLSKPNIEGFNIIKKTYPRINKENMLFVGDSLISDKIAADNTGIKFFHYKRS